MLRSDRLKSGETPLQDAPRLYSGERGFSEQWESIFITHALASVLLSARGLTGYASNTITAVSVLGRGLTGWQTGIIRASDRFRRK
jgi:hypothetical protein